MVVVLVQRGGPLDPSKADAQVQIALRKGTTAAAARSHITDMATGEWQGTRVGEDTQSDDASKIVIALPGANLDGAISALRRYDQADSVKVKIDVSPDQVQVAPLSSTSGSATPAKPVRLEVDINESSPGGPWVTMALTVVVLAASIGGLLWAQRRGGDADDAYEA